MEESKTSCYIQLGLRMGNVGKTKQRHRGLSAGSYCRAGTNDRVLVPETSFGMEKAIPRLNGGSQCPANGH